MEWFLNTWSFIHGGLQPGLEISRTVEQRIVSIGARHCSLLRSQGWEAQHILYKQLAVSEWPGATDPGNVQPRVIVGFVTSPHSWQLWRGVPFSCVQTGADGKASCLFFCSCWHRRIASRSITSYCCVAAGFPQVGSPPHVTTTPELERSTRGQTRAGLGKANPEKCSGLWRQEVVSVIAVF